MTDQRLGEPSKLVGLVPGAGDTKAASLKAHSTNSDNLLEVASVEIPFMYNLLGTCL